MKLKKFEELRNMYEQRVVLKHFIDGPEEALFIGMNGVTNQVGLRRELDMKVRVLLGIEVGRIEQALQEAGIDMQEEQEEGVDESGDTGEEGEVIDTTATPAKTDEEDSAK